jgi:putative sigma-54 modulation protein
MDVTPALKNHVEASLEKVRSHFDRVIDAEVVLSVEKHRHIAEITMNANGIRIHGKEEQNDMYASIDNVVDKLDKQVRRFKGRINDYKPRETKEDRAFQYNVIAVSAEEEAEAEADGHTVVTREQLTMKPMSVEEATMQLELANEEFLVFSNAETQKVNVLYARQDGTYGLIEPQF